MDWKNKAKTIIKVELAKQGVDYIELAKRLNEKGIKETQSSIATKISRGTFGFTFALQVFDALDLKNLQLGEKI